MLRGYNLQELRRVHCTIYGFWPDFRLAYLNNGWFQFARDNGGDGEFFRKWGIGSVLLDAISEDLRPYYKAKFSTCLFQKVPWSHEYDCSSSVRYRRFRMVAYPLRQNAGILVVNFPFDDRPLTDTSGDDSPPSEVSYRNSQGNLTQCSHCRRTRNPSAANEWDWLPAWIDSIPDDTLFALCPTCIGFYIPSSE